jgi:hypothetical protein
MGPPDTAQPNRADKAPGSGAASAAGASPAADSAAGSVQAAVVPASGHGTPYRMYEAEAVTAEGATLRGGLALEVNEEVTLELRLPGRPTGLRAAARVVEVLHGKPPAMKVVWTELADADRRSLRG